MFHLIVNANDLQGKKQKKIAAIEKVFNRAGKKYEIFYTEYKGHAKKIAEEITSKLDGGAIIAVGGDGTLHEVFNGIRDLGKFSLGVIPIGSGNDFAKAVGISSDCTKAAEVVAFRAPVAIDYIQLESGLRSINSVGFGIDVDVLKYAYSGKRRGHKKYLFALLKAVRRFSGYKFTVKVNGEEKKKFGFIAAMGNGSTLGGGIKLFPSAKVDDGKMNLICVDYLSKWKILGAFIKLMRGKVDKIKGAECAECTECEIIPDGENFSLQAEGEIYDDIPVKAKLVAGGLKFYLP